VSIGNLHKSVAVAAAMVLSLGGAAGAEEPDFISLGAGVFDFNRQKDEGGESRLEYRSRIRLGPLKPFAAASGSTSGHFLISGGVLMDLFFGRRVVITPSFAPGYYTGGNSELDLGHELEFRSQIEFAYRFDDRSRLGLAVSHTSNASIADTNPGSESAILYSR
jgi:hypothetical protein